MQTTSGLFIKNIQNLPMWVKQVLAVELSEDLNRKLADFTTLVSGDKLFQYIKPKISIKGKIELDTRSVKLSEGYYIFMNDSLKGEDTIFEITVKNNWALSDTAKIFLRLYELEYITTIGNIDNTSIAIASFIAGKIKTGEFLKSIRKIDAVQLDSALRYQKKLNEEGRHMKMASILIKMGYITDRGLDSLLQLKEEAKRRLPSNLGLRSDIDEGDDNNYDIVQRLQREISRLENENIIMKKHLKKLLHMG